ncbi:unnamed protein product [Didymodactylos carnosus]|uniref:Phosphatidylinositol transfer protein N-terminal domain-containing protein n=1 Tax=Didymodactylos carnosus TaxID=1234261 RepID=A0A813NVR0_9BILA|nr:unnamed protein product [Didymodactylos carnosus]CAF1554703.1 unnamed protein product [Didymodactylos carnosus]CAF3519570.1 unnamed protein product [Didymodactylos carnosus]CAF4345388.1 unnamed protein product [Didymodactylos carnosus]
MRYKEFRIPLPLTVDEYKIGQQWTELQILRETWISCQNCVTFIDEPKKEYEISASVHRPLKGIHTHKKYNLTNQTPKFLDLISSKSSGNGIELDECSWYDYPYTLTIIKNEEHRITITIQSVYLQDSGTTDNPFHLTKDQLDKRTIEIINIASKVNDDYKKEEDPLLCQSKKIERNPFSKSWWESLTSNHQHNQAEKHSSQLDDVPIMCCYKLVEISTDEKSKLKAFIANTVSSSLIFNAQKEIYHRFHQKLFCNIDNWYELSLITIHEDEERLKRQIKSINIDKEKSMPQEYAQKHRKEGELMDEEKKHPSKAARLVTLMGVLKPQSESAAWPNCTKKNI